MGATNPCALKNQRGARNYSLGPLDPLVLYGIRLLAMRAEPRWSWTIGSVEHWVYLIIHRGNVKEVLLPSDIGRGRDDGQDEVDLLPPAEAAGGLGQGGLLPPPGYQTGALETSHWSRPVQILSSHWWTPFYAGAKVYAITTQSRQVKYH